MGFQIVGRMRDGTEITLETLRRARAGARSCGRERKIMAGGKIYVVAYFSGVAKYYLYDYVEGADYHRYRYGGNESLGLFDNLTDACYAAGIMSGG